MGQVDQAILSEEDRIVLIRFGHDWDPTCMKMDETLYSIAEKCKNFVVIYLVDITEVPDFNKMYELYDPCTIMFFFQPEEEHDGAGVVELVHLVKVGHLSDVDQVDHHKVLALLSDRIQCLIHFHAGRVPVVTEPDE